MSYFAVKLEVKARVRCLKINFPFTKQIEKNVFRYVVV